MGAVPPLQLAHTSATGSLISKRRLGYAALALLAATTLSSARAAAGLRELPASAHEAALADSGSIAQAQPVPFAALKSESTPDGFASLDALAPELLRPRFPTEAPPMAEGWKFSDPTLAVTNATPKPPASTQPLLIPLPTGSSAGLVGLTAVALIMAPRKIRRMLLS